MVSDDESSPYMARIRRRVETYDEDDSSSKSSSSSNSSSSSVEEVASARKGGGDEEVARGEALLDAPPPSSSSSSARELRGAVSSSSPRRSSAAGPSSAKRKKSKNGPAEQSSKKARRPPPQVAPTEKVERRDPRFDALCGRLDRDVFRKRFDFLEVSDPETERKDRERAVVRAIRKEERDKVKSGKKPFYLKRAAIKQKILDDKFDHLKDTGKLNKFLKRKQRKNRTKGLLDQRVAGT